jgi:hypothetical protein
MTPDDTSLHSVCHEPFEAALAEVYQSLDSGLVATLREGLEKHRTAVKEVGLDGEAPEAWEDRANAFLRYHRTVSSELIGPLLRHYQGTSPAATITERLKGATDQSFILARGLPVQAPVEWPADALASRQSDGALRGLGKPIARVISAARKSGVVRECPLRSTALWHLDRVVAPRMDTRSLMDLVAWAQWSREVERAWVNWAALLPDFVHGESLEYEDVTALWGRVSAGAEKLDADLGALLTNTPTVYGEEGSGALLGEARATLEADLAVAGSFLYSPTWDDDVPPALRKLERAEAAFLAIDEGVAGRFVLYEAILGVLAGGSAVRERLLGRFRNECLEGVQGLVPLAARLEKLIDELPPGASPEQLPAILDGVRARANVIAAPVLAEFPDEELVDAILVDGAGTLVDALAAMVYRAPRALRLNAESLQVKPRMRKADTRTMPFQELARQSFDVLRIDRIRSSPEPLIESVSDLRKHITELDDVFSFAFESAKTELETGEEGATDQAAELVGDALRNIAESVRVECEGVEADYLSTRDRLATEIGSGALDLIGRASADGVAAQVLAARSRLADLRVWGVDRWGPDAARVARMIRYRSLLVKRWATRGYRSVSRMVAGSPGEEFTSTRLVRLLADATALTSSLPAVYQKLFTLGPLSESSLLAARSSEMADLKSRWKRWQAGGTIPVVFRARPGSGVTSLLSAFCAEVREADESVRLVTIDLAERVHTEEQLVAILAEALGLAAEGTMVSLTQAIREAEADALPQVVVLDDLEHAYLRVPGGTLVMDLLLSVMVETESRLFWVSAITASAWQVVSTSEPDAVSQVDVVELSPLDSAGIREAITIRHRRSGLLLKYDRPKTGRRILRRRLDRARTEEARKKLLEDDYFDQVARTSSGHLQLALFQWLQCADFENEDGLLIRSPTRPDFSVLSGLSLTQDFSLKAFLEHRTLTLDEHDAIFRLGGNDSFQIFESLRHRHLVAQVQAAPGSSDAGRDPAIIRYRIHPLLIGAVIGHLRGRNIVH